MSIRLENLSKRFGHTLVVNHVTLEVADGELFILLGGSGSGKSTILRLIAGLLSPNAGRIVLDGRDVTALAPQARGVGFVFQNYSIFRHMTAWQNIEFGLRIRKTPSAERAARVQELLDLVGLTGLGQRYADQLSGGQQQRVALARALAYRPAVLLLDEPFGALDVKIRAQMRESLKQIQRHLKVTTLLVTHDQEEAFELADRIGVIEHGSLWEVGPPQEIYHRPRTEFVATFVGGGNVLVGRAQGGRIALGSIDLPMPADAPAHEEDSPVRILFRPESVVVQPEPLDARAGLFPLGRGQACERVFAGALQRLRLTMEGLRGVRPLSPLPTFGQATTQLEATLPGELDARSFAPGTPLWVGIRRYHVLDSTGMKMLICAQAAPDGDAAIEVGCQLATAASDPVMLLSTAPSAQALAPARERLETLRQRWLERLPRLEARARQGEWSTEILLHAQEGHYELVVLERSAGQVGLDATALQLLEMAEVPVLLVAQPHRSFVRVLVCTAAGEPGKADVRFGGRLAKRIGASVTLLHVQREGASSEEAHRAQRHLEQAKSSLQALGVQAEVLVQREPAVHRILDTAEQGKYDLIVIGAPAPRSGRPMREADLATPIVAGTLLPVLIVPMAE